MLELGERARLVALLGVELGERLIRIAALGIELLGSAQLLLGFIDVAIVDTVPLGVDTPEDLEKARAMLTGR